MDEKMSDIDQQTFHIYSALACVIDQQYSEQIDQTFFEAAVLALLATWNNLTTNETDLLEFIGILNKIVVQGLLERGAKPE